MMSSILHDFLGLSVNLFPCCGQFVEPSEAKAHVCVVVCGVFSHTCWSHTCTSVSDSVWMDGKSNGSLHDRTKLNSVIQEFMLNLR